MYMASVDVACEQALPRGRSDGGAKTPEGLLAGYGWLGSPVLSSFDKYRSPWTIVTVDDKNISGFTERSKGITEFRYLYF